MLNFSLCSAKKNPKNKKNAYKISVVETANFGRLQRSLRNIFMYY